MKKTIKYIIRLALICLLTVTVGCSPVTEPDDGTDSITDIRVESETGSITGGESGDTAESETDSVTGGNTTRDESSLPEETSSEFYIDEVSSEGASSEATELVTSDMLESEEATENTEALESESESESVSEQTSESESELESEPDTTEEISRVAVLKKYQYSITPNTNIGYLGSSEDDRANIFAWYDLSKLYCEICGVQLEFSFVNSIDELDQNGGYLILGGELAEQSGLTYDGISTQNGHKIVKKNGNIYLYGKSGYGTANAMYAFLKQAFGAEFYTDTVYTTDGRVEWNYSDISNETFNPSVDNQWSYDGLLFTDNGNQINYAYQMRLGFVNYWHILGGNIHGFDTVFPESRYPTYYNNGVVDLNSAGAINTSNSMVNAVADWLYDQTSGSNKTLYAFGPTDIRKWSQSEASQANYEKFGSNSGEYLLFMNAVVELLNTSPNYENIRDVKILMLSYNEALKAPTKALDELAVDRSPARGVSLQVMFAPIEMNINDKPTESYIKDFYNGTPALYYAEYDKWQQIFDERDVHFWRYSAGFNDFFVPVNIIEHMQANYKEIVGSDNYIGHLMDQGPNKSPVQTNFQALAIYLKGQLGKDVNADVNMLTDKFCRAYYGEEAGEYMKQLLLSEQKHSAKLKSEMNSTFRDVSGCHYFPDTTGVTVYNIFGKKYWGENCRDDGGAMLKEWYGYIEAALECTANRTIEKRIKTEAVNIRYMSLKVYNTGVFNGDSLEKLKSDAAAFGITQWSEGRSINDMPI